MEQLFDVQTFCTKLKDPFVAVRILGRKEQEELIKEFSSSILTPLLSTYDYTEEKVLELLLNKAIKEEDHDMACWGANNGLPSFQNLYGFLMYTRDEENARSLYWFRKAAEKGNFYAKMNLFLCDPDLPVDSFKEIYKTGLQQNNIQCLYRMVRELIESGEKGKEGMIVWMLDKGKQLGSELCKRQLLIHQRGAKHISDPEEVEEKSDSFHYPEPIVCPYSIYV